MEQHNTLNDFKTWVDELSELFEHSTEAQRAFFEEEWKTITTVYGQLLSVNRDCSEREQTILIIRFFSIISRAKEQLSGIANSPVNILFLESVVRILSGLEHFDLERTAVHDPVLYQKIPPSLHARIGNVLKALSEVRLSLENCPPGDAQTLKEKKAQISTEIDSICRELTNPE